MAEIKKLDKVLNIAGNDFEVQAKSAEKVENKLTIYEVINETTENPVQFDGYVPEGEEAPEVFVVSADKGGYFRGPIGVPSVTTQPKASQVINYGDLTTTVKNLAGSGWYTWDGTTTELQAVVKNEVSQHVGVVLGLSEHLQQFVFENAKLAAMPEENKYSLPSFLYICTDNGNLYFGTSEDSESFFQIVNQAKALVSETNYFDADSLELRLNSMSNSISGRIDTVIAEEAAAHEALKQTDAGLRADVNTNSNNIDMLEDTFTDILDPDVDLFVKNASHATDSDKLGSHPANYFQKQILIRQNAPGPNDGAEGDICIVWN